MGRFISAGLGVMVMSSLLWAVLLAAPAVAAKKFAAIDRHALAAPNSAERSIPKLAAYLARPARTELEKARAIYRWVTHNIAYDAAAFFSRNFRNTSATADSVLKTRKGVCDGYSRIYQGLAKAAGLEVVRVAGYAKGFGFELGDKIPKESNHAWNAVKVGGKWILVDSTWGAGAVDGSKRKFVRKFQGHYFQTKPEEMIYAHLPEDAKWQLLDKPVSREKFAILPKLHPLFFKHNLKLESHKDGEIKTGDRLKVSLNVPADSDVIATVEQGGRNLDSTLYYVKRDGGRTYVNALFPKRGSYILRIFVKPQKSKGSYGGAMEYLVRASKGTENRYPDYGMNFFEHGLKLESHKDGNIKTGDTLELRVGAPRHVALIASLLRNGKKLPGNLLHLQREGESYKINAVFPRRGQYTLRIFSNDRGSNNRGGKGTYFNAIDYMVTAARGAGAQAGFPVFYGKYSEIGARLHEPMKGSLISGATQEFRLSAPGATNVAVVIGKKWTHLTRLNKKGSEFSGKAPIGKGKISVFVNFNGGKGSWDGLLQYTGR